MKTRLQYIITNEGLTNIRFAELLGVNPASVSHVLAERNKPSFDFIVKIAENLPQYNLRWLLTGKGEPIISSVKLEPSLMPVSAAAITSSQQAEAASLDNAANSLPPRDADCASEQNSNNDTKAEVSSETIINATNSKLIVCFPDGTFEEYIHK